jgi:hypothetical protein
MLAFFVAVVAALRSTTRSRLEFAAEILAHRRCRLRLELSVGNTTA